MRSSWEDPLATWCGVKAGFDKVPHGHIDLGNFEFETDGIRWAIDLGKDDYNLPGYRLKSESHKIPLIAGKGQLVEGVAKVLFDKTGRQELARSQEDDECLIASYILIFEYKD